VSKIFLPTTNAGKIREFNHSFSLLNKECIGTKEARVLLGDLFDWKIPIEDRQTFSGNGCRKLAESIRFISELERFGVNSVLVDDSGLCVSRLNFEPGVHSATYAGEPRCDHKNRQFLAESLSNQLGLSSDDFEPAFFVCSLLHAERDLSAVESKQPVCDGFEVMMSEFEGAEKGVFDRMKTRLMTVASAAYSFEQRVLLDENIFRVSLIFGFCTGFVSVTEQQLLDGEGHGYDAMFYPKARPQLSFASIPLLEKNKMSHRSEALRGFSELEKSRSALGEIRELF
jgi:XTP/dITP diphosphohydrolase